MAALAVLPSAAQATPTDPMIEGAKLCTQYLPRYEREYGIPVHLLAAISSTESGRYHEGLKITLPWPWTINVEGKGYFYDTKQQAISAVRKFQAQGAKSIDIGCMQVNLRHHPNAFSSLEDAFEPERNIAYAASFLRNLFQETNSWKEAAAAYHSRTPSFGAQYVSRVYDRWYTIIDRVRKARVNMAQASGGVAAGEGLTKAEAYAANEATSVNKKASLGKGSAVPAGSRLATMSLAGQPARSYRIPSATQTKVIEVRNSGSSASRDTTRENGVSVVRPEQPSLLPVVSSTPIMPSAQPVSAVAVAAISPSAGTPQAKVIQGPGHVTPAVQAGPRFIFSD